MSQEENFKSVLLQRAISSFKRQVSAYEGNMPEILIKFILPCLDLILKDASVFQEKCTSNENLSPQLISELQRNRSDFDEIEIVTLFAVLYQIASEVIFRTESTQIGFPSVATELFRLVELVRYKGVSIGPQLEMHTVYSDLYLPTDILKRTLEKPNYKMMENFQEEFSKLPNAIDEVNKQIRDVKQISDALEKYKVNFNFVGLYQGFNNIARAKRTSANLHVALLWGMCVLMLSPFLVKAWLISAAVSAGQPVAGIGEQGAALQGGVDRFFSALGGINLDLIVLVAGFELLMLYFFRVVLSSYRSVQGQLVQLDLRRTLCQFIQHYATYAKDINKDSPGLMDRFEQLIFSGIVANEDRIPSTLDGIDQLAKVLDQLKPK
nr:hypothetical protein [uncultured Pseudomonas sp.]